METSPQSTAAAAEGSKPESSERVSNIHTRLDRAVPRVSPTLSRHPTQCLLLRVQLPAPRSTSFLVDRRSPTFSSTPEFSHTARRLSHCEYSRSSHAD